MSSGVGKWVERVGHSVGHGVAVASPFTEARGFSLVQSLVDRVVTL